MRTLVTGAAGQDGYLLCESLLKRGWDVTGSKLKHEILISGHPLSSNQVVNLDVSDKTSVEELIGQLKPEVIYHLAGITSVGFSIKEPELTHAVNVGGTRNILESVLKHELKDTLVVHAASTEIFSDQSGVISESSDLGPRSPYGESKAKAFELCRVYRALGVKATNAVLSNHESFLRPVDFVTGKIANGVARISLGMQSEIALGNTDVAKDWSAASDVVRGLTLIAEREFIGDVILASGVSTHLHEIIEKAFAYVGISNWQDYIKSDVALKRVGESKSIQLDTSKAFSELGWTAHTPMPVWIGEMIESHIAKVALGQD
jgi:GDPmannose 4,6-dehydratase